MATDSRIIHNVYIRSAERLTNSRDGNPRYRLATDLGNYETQADAAVNYGIANLTNSRIAETYAIGDDAPLVDLVVTVRGSRVIGIQRDGEHLA